MGLYDKIRKRKKENLEQIYKNLTHPTSMAEAISSPAKFASVTGKDTGAYETSTPSVDTDASTKSGEEIVNTIEDEGKCVNGFWVGGENNGEECSEITPDENIDKLEEAKNKIKDFKGSRDDVNPDMKEGVRGIFGKQKGGSALGNILRKIVGKTGEAEILDAAPFGDPVAKDNHNLGGNTGGTGGEGSGTVQDTFELEDGTVIKTDFKGGTIGDEETSEDVDPTKTFTGMDDACSEEYIAANGSDACDKWKKDNEANPCHGAEADGRAKACTDKGGTLQVVEGVCKCVTSGSDGTPSSITSDVIPGTEKEVPGETSTNLEFAQQLRTNWGQNLLDARTRRKEKLNLVADKRDFTGNEKDLFNEARKNLRQSGDLPGTKDEKLRAIYNEMDRLNGLRDSKTQLEGTFGGQRSIYNIAQGIKDGTGPTYKELVAMKDDQGNPVYSDADLKEIRNLADSQGDTGQGIEFQRTDEETLPPEYTNTLDEEQLELVKGAKNEAEARAILKKYYDAEAERKKKEEEDNKSEEDNNPPTDTGDHSVYSKPPAQIKSGSFKMKRGKLMRPGY